MDQVETISVMPNFDRLLLLESFKLGKSTDLKLEAFIKAKENVQKTDHISMAGPMVSLSESLDIFSEIHVSERE